MYNDIDDYGLRIKCVNVVVMMYIWYKIDVVFRSEEQTELQVDFKPFDRRYFEVSVE